LHCILRSVSLSQLLLFFARWEIFTLSFDGAWWWLVMACDGFCCLATHQKQIPASQSDLNHWSRHLPRPCIPRRTVRISDWFTVAVEYSALLLHGSVSRCQVLAR
jgi:hypothetical protein